jgi:hypothetical protein
LDLTIKNLIMKRIFFVLFSMIGLLGFQSQTDQDCNFNLKINEDWEGKLTEKQLPLDFVEKKSFLNEYDTTKMNNREIFQKSIQENVFYFKSTGENSKEIQLNETVFHTPCAAYERFKDAFFYFHTKWPRYEKNTHPCAYLVQNNKLFVISAQPGEEKLMEKFIESFLKILLVDSFQEGSLFVRYTESKAVLK